MTKITTRGVEQRASVCTMIEFNSTVIDRVIGSVLAANAVDRQLYVRLLVDVSQKGEAQGGSDWGSPREITGILGTDAKSLFDHQQNRVPNRNEHQP